MCLWKIFLLRVLRGPVSSVLDIVAINIFTFFLIFSVFKSIFLLFSLYHFDFTIISTFFNFHIFHNFFIQHFANFIDYMKIVERCKTSIIWFWQPITKEHSFLYFLLFNRILEFERNNSDIIFKCLKKNFTSFHLTWHYLDLLYYS